MHWLTCPVCRPWRKRSRAKVAARIRAHADVVFWQRLVAEINAERRAKRRAVIDSAFKSPVAAVLVSDYPAYDPLDYDCTLCYSKRRVMCITSGGNTLYPLNSHANRWGHQISPAN
jgi:hypothetical protein